MPKFMLASTLCCPSIDNKTRSALQDGCKLRWDRNMFQSCISNKNSLRPARLYGWKLHWFILRRPQFRTGLPRIFWIISKPESSFGLGHLGLILKLNRLTWLWLRVIQAKELLQKVGIRYVFLFQKGGVAKRVSSWISVSTGRLCNATERVWGGEDTTATAGSSRITTHHCQGRWDLEWQHPAEPRWAGAVWWDRSNALSSHCLCWEVLGKRGHPATHDQELSQADTSLSTALAEEITGREGCQEGTWRSTASLKKKPAENKANEQISQSWGHLDVVLLARECCRAGKWWNQVLSWSVQQKPRDVDTDNCSKS